LKKQKNRLDVEMVGRGLADTRQKAQALILSGMVTVEGQRVDKAGHQVGPEDDIGLIGEPMPYVSRGGLKLKGALDEFGLDVAGFVCVDVGASTGGFTDCLLQAGAARVYAIDVGYGQMDQKVANDPRVSVMDRTNVRHLEPNALPEKADLAVIDVSFISLGLVLGPVKGMLKPGGMIVALVKPQFEVGKGNVGKGGIVRDEAQRLGALETVKGFAAAEGFAVAGETVSPVTGAKGNVEYLLFLRLDG